MLDAPQPDYTDHITGRSTPWPRNQHGAPLMICEARARVIAEFEFITNVNALSRLQLHRFLDTQQQPAAAPNPSRLAPDSSQRLLVRTRCGESTFIARRVASSLSGISSCSRSQQRMAHSVLERVLWGYTRRVQVEPRGALLLACFAHASCDACCSSHRPHSRSPPLSCSPSRATHVAQAACAVRMKVTPDIFAAAKHGDTQLVADHVFVDPSLVSKRDVV